MDSVKIFTVNFDKEDILQEQINEWVKKIKPEIKNSSISINTCSIAVAITYKVTKD